MSRPANSTKNVCLSPSHLLCKPAQRYLHTLANLLFWQELGAIILVEVKALGPHLHICTPLPWPHLAASLQEWTWASPRPVVITSAPAAGSCKASPIQRDSDTQLQASKQSMEVISFLCLTCSILTIAVLHLWNSLTQS